jgi:hypothetical protein
MVGDMIVIPMVSKSVSHGSVKQPIKVLTIQKNNNGDAGRTADHIPRVILAS